MLFTNFFKIVFLCHNILNGFNNIHLTDLILIRYFFYIKHNTKCLRIAIF